MSTLYVWEAANLFVGDEDPTKSKHLTIMSLKLPTLEEILQEHHAGGARVQIEIEVGIRKLDLKPFRLFSTEPAAFGFAYKLLRLFKRLKI